MWCESPELAHCPATDWIVFSTLRRKCGPLTVGCEELDQTETRDGRWTEFLQFFDRDRERRNCGIGNAAGMFVSSINLWWGLLLLFLYFLRPWRWSDDIWAVNDAERSTTHKAFRVWYHNRVRPPCTIVALFFARSKVAKAHTPRTDGAWGRGRGNNSLQFCKARGGCANSTIIHFV